MFFAGLRAAVFSKINLTCARRNNKIALITLEKLHHDILEPINCSRLRTPDISKIMNDIPVYTEESERPDWQRVQCGPHISGAMFAIENKIVILCVRF